MTTAPESHLAHSPQTPEQHEQPRLRVTTKGPSGWSIALGVILVIASLFLLGNVILTTAVSVYVIGATALIGGIVMVIWALMNTGRENFWLGIVSGVLLAVLGGLVLANPGVGIVALTMVAGAAFLAGGITRLVVAATVRTGRGWLIFGGIVSVLLALYVLFNFAAATFTLLGTIVGVSMLVDGITMLFGSRTVVTTA